MDAAKRFHGGLLLFGQQGLDLRDDGQCVVVAAAGIEILGVLERRREQKPVQPPLGRRALANRKPAQAVYEPLEDGNGLIVVLVGQRAGLEQQIFPTPLDDFSRGSGVAHVRSISRFTVWRSVSARRSGRL